VIILEYLNDPDLAVSLVWRPAVIGLALVLLCAVLSVLVVLKRLAFVGQGISHSAFGGVGVAAVLAVLAQVWGLGDLLAADGSGAAWIEFVIVLLFCIAAAVLMASVSDRKAVHIDTGIGLFLVASMALGGVLVEVARQAAAARGLPTSSRTWESILFGSISGASWTDAAVAWGVAIGVALTLWLLRRPLLFWSFDETSAEAFGVRTRLMRATLMVLLAVAVVTSMRLAGVVPATALLVLPGAIALRLSSRMGRVLVLACAAGVAGLLVGLWASLQFDVQLGNCIVLALTAGFALAALWNRGGSTGRGL
jgi:ABC-type Mn2+/Zn2+ transport system permease subunit